MREMQEPAYHQRLISHALNLLFPSQCPACSRATDSLRHSPFCRSCWGMLSHFAGPRCSICATPLSSEHAHVCGPCTANQPFFSRIQCFGLYQGTLAAAINMMKFDGIRRLHRPLATLLCTLETGPVDAIIAVPISRSSLQKRGFNQSLLLARLFAKHRRAPLLLDCLKKTKETPPQVGLSSSARNKNVRGAFSANHACAAKRIVLVDDVVTTGATVNECARVLRKRGAEDVSVIALARAGEP